LVHRTEAEKGFNPRTVAVPAKVVPDRVYMTVKAQKETPTATIEVIVGPEDAETGEINK